MPSSIFNVYCKLTSLIKHHIRKFINVLMPNGAVFIADWVVQIASDVEN